MAAYAKDLNTAETAYAAIDEVCTKAYFNIVLLSRELQQLRTDRGWLDLFKEKSRGILEIKCYKNAVDYWKMVATKLLNMKAMLSCTHEANCWPEAQTKFLEITFLLNCHVTKSKM